MLTITLQMQERQCDLMVLPQQRMWEVLKVLEENKIIYALTEKVQLYSHRNREYVNHRLTFQQARIYSGDILELRLSTFS